MIHTLILDEVEVRIVLDALEYSDLDGAFELIEKIENQLKGDGR